MPSGFGGCFSALTVQSASNIHKPASGRVPAVQGSRPRGWNRCPAGNASVVRITSFPVAPACWPVALDEIQRMSVVPSLPVCTWIGRNWGQASFPRPIFTLRPYYTKGGLHIRSHGEFCGVQKLTFLLHLLSLPRAMPGAFKPPGLPVKARQVRDPARGLQLIDRAHPSLYTHLEGKQGRWRCRLPRSVASPLGRSEVVSRSGSLVNRCGNTAVTWRRTPQVNRCGIAAAAMQHMPRSEPNPSGTSIQPCFHPGGVYGSAAPLPHPARRPGGWEP